MPTLHVKEGPMKGQSFEFTTDTVFVGRSSRNDVKIQDSSISRKHLKIFRIEKSFFVEDLRSTNGTFINGQSVSPGEGIQVDQGDTITIGETILHLDVSSQREAPDINELMPPPSQEALVEKTHLGKERRSRSLREVELICKICQLIEESSNIDVVLQSVLESILHSLPRIDRAAVFLLDSEDQQIKKQLTRSRQDQGNEADCDPSLVSRVFQDGKALMISMKSSEAPIESSENWGTSEIRSVMCVPMSSGTKPRGAIYLEGLSKNYTFREEDLLLIKAISGLLGLAIQNAQLAASIEELRTDQD